MSVCSPIRPSACSPVRLLARPPACPPAHLATLASVSTVRPSATFVCRTLILRARGPRACCGARRRVLCPSHPRTRLLFVGPICLLSIMRAVLQQRRASTTAAAATSWHDDAGGYELTRRWGTEYSGTRGTRLGRGQHSEHGARGSEHAREREGASEDDDGGGDELARCCERRIVAVSWGRTGTTGGASSERGGGGGEQGGERRRRRARR
ncbi:uncharacterized protein B0H18DRAFT_1002409 [Fomitopsis serialis]|uniref:uncharacterized protein n=1 Tax=Fomitopsis serialis TaxID=139415 RepID=UPI0020073C23|nr:uncharacterized protein B0H18DRAFT_1002409 [Neoantrodia serialis]KAH9927825.1 hypothetical protein B0H18DRAFT_1002409 [Neoantrodia serialis]